MQPTGKDNNRRKFLKQSSTLFGGALLTQSIFDKATAISPSLKSGSNAATVVGEWLQASNGLPVYQYKGHVPFKAVDKNGKDALLPEDPFFILGNYKCTLFAHASGIVQLLTGQRAWARINAADEINYGANSATIRVNGNVFELIGIGSQGASEAVTNKYFGTGFARYEYTLPSALQCTRILSVKPSTKIHTGNPSVAITVQLKNTGQSNITVAYEERYRINYIPINQQRKDVENRRAVYPASITTDATKQTAIATVSFKANAFLTGHKKEESNFNDTDPVSFFMQALQTTGSNIQCVAATDGVPALCGKVTVDIAPGAIKSFTFILGLTYQKEMVIINRQVKDLLLNAKVANPAEGLFIQQWQAALPNFDAEKNEVLKKEMLWNAYTLETMATYSEYFKETYIPQGMLYTYQDGENISNRDHAQAMLPMCYTNPALAKSSLRYILKHSTYIGEIKRGSGGFGYIEPNVYQESDEQLYLFLSLAEYLRITKDYQLLNETVSYYPVEYLQTARVSDILKKHFIYLRDVVGKGRNGLIRILNSDWSDSFFHKYSPNIYAGTAESVLNTTMALAVLPNLLSQLTASKNAALLPFIKAIENYHSELLAAFLKDFGNRDFAARCYLNGGQQERLGTEHVCIEPQGYLLQIPTLSNERKATIYKKVKSATAEKEKIGFRTREVPMWSKSGEGEDGGIWFSLEGAVVAGVVSFNKEEAWALLQKMSFTNFAKHYPDYWVGHWTAPDFINSSLSSREGLYTFWEPNLKNAFKGFCSHPHSWPLYCYYKLKE